MMPGYFITKSENYQVFAEKEWEKRPNGGNLGLTKQTEMAIIKSVPAGVLEPVDRQA